MLLLCVKVVNNQEKKGDDFKKICGALFFFGGGGERKERMQGRISRGRDGGKELQVASSWFGPAAPFAEFSLSLAIVGTVNVVGG